MDDNSELHTTSSGINIEQVPIGMDENEEKEDVDVFVSPRHFGGRTPGPKQTKRKVFEEEQSKKEKDKGNLETGDSTINFDRVKYNYDSERGMSHSFL